MTIDKKRNTYQCTPKSLATFVLIAFFHLTLSFDKHSAVNMGRLVSCLNFN